MVAERIYYRENHIQCFARARRSVIMFVYALHTIQFCGEEFYNGIAWKNKLNHNTNDDWFAAGVSSCENMPNQLIPK